MECLISIIIPLFNKGNSVGRCIDSIISQSYSNVEIIVIDDGSVDNSAAVVKAYNDSRIKYRYKTNGGVSSARNVGIQEATGEWIMYIDADDYMLPDALCVLLRTAIRRKVKVVTGNYYLELNNKREVFCYGWDEKVLGNNFRSWYFRTSMPCPGSVMFHRSVLKSRTFNENLKRYEDAEFMFSIMREFKMAYTPSFVMVYSRDNSSLSKNYTYPYNDYIYNMNFENKKFWEKVVLGTLLNEGLSIYKEKEDELREKYSNYLIYSFVDLKIRRLKRWVRKIYKWRFC